MKTIAEQLNVKEFPFTIKDKNCNEIYYEDENGYWVKTEYDSKGNRIYWEDSYGYKASIISNYDFYDNDVEPIKNKEINKKMQTIAEQLNVKEFPFTIKDKNGNESYWEDSKGLWIKTEYDSKGNRIYTEDSNGCWINSKYDSKGNEIYWEDSTGFWIKTEYDSKENRIYWEDSTGFWIKTEYDSKRNRIYNEDSYGYWIKTEYDSKGNKIYWEDSNGYKSDKRVTELTLDQIAEKFGIEVSQLKIKK